MEVNLSAKLNTSGFKLQIQNRHYDFSYQPGSFSALKENQQQFVLDNFVYALTRPISIVTHRPLRYNTGQPIFKNFIDWGIKEDLGRVADYCRVKTKKLVNDFKQSQRPGQIKFASGKIIKSLTFANNISANKAVLAMSFGKDSLLSYGLAKEIGLNVSIVSDLDPQVFTKKAWALRQQEMAKFCQQEHCRINWLQDNLDEILAFARVSHKFEELENVNGTMVFTCAMLPFLIAKGARYLIFGSERNLSDFYINTDGYKSYPSFDQSTVYYRKLNQQLNKATANKFQTISVIEQLYNLAEMKILYHRYPHLVKFTMSCYPTKAERWCCSCGMCAKAFLYSAAVGGNPKVMGLNKNMFSKKEAGLYPLFAKKIKRPYEKPIEVREEQLLSFLLAYRNGWKGELIDLFKKKYLAEAVAKEKILRKKYLGIQPAVNLPLNLRVKLNKIFTVELKSWH